MTDFLAENELFTLRNRFKRDAELLLQGISDDGEEKSKSCYFCSCLSQGNVTYAVKLDLSMTKIC